MWINCSSDLKNFANSWLSASNFKSFSWSVEQFFLTVGQNNFGNKIPNFTFYLISKHFFFPSVKQKHTEFNNKQLKKKDSKQHTNFYNQTTYYRRSQIRWFIDLVVTFSFWIYYIKIVKKNPLRGCVLNFPLEYNNITRSEYHKAFWSFYIQKERASTESINYLIWILL